MKLRLALVGLLALLLGVAISGSAAHAAPALQLSWLTGSQHRINSGNATYNCGSTHQASNAYAIDFEFSIGQTVSAVASGTVSAAQMTNDARGNFVEIDHGGGYKTRYLHLRFSGPWPPEIDEGVSVAQGQHIAYSGDTGGVSPHLHFDMKLNGNAHKPEPMSGVTGFGQYGYCTGVASPYWTSWPSNGWFHLKDCCSIRYGLASDVPLVGDGNNDTKDRPVLWRSSNVTFYFNDCCAIPYGFSSDVPLVGDGNSDGKDRPVVWRSSNVTFYFNDCCAIPYGFSSDVPLVGDGNGDGKDGPVVWRNNDFYFKDCCLIKFGLSTDIPLVGDWDGDGKDEPGVWRPGP